MADVRPTGRHPAADTDETRLAYGSSPPTSGWLSSSDTVDHGRFAPGEVLDSRYRVLGLLGRGGMGEVYRADDLRLGQPVALKFLPESLSHDPVRLAQFHNEVRTARQVSHPNVCRVYDVGEAAGVLFLTMEYVDGEDLSSLLRRIGRLPEDKALEIARQICAGLAAAHERGVIHRDLKPANIMLDGAGQVRLMDFSLATVGVVTNVRAGTPAYMAPEQLEGRDATIKSDIYALGLVLYELFTGRRVFDAKALPDLVAQHTSGIIMPPSQLVSTLDPAIERTILRCLEADQARRPSTALAVSASLPGGDPLAAALAAGETPSPEMVAAAGGESAMLSPAAGVAWLACSGLLLLAVAWLADRTSLLARIPLKPVAVLVDRAEELRRSLGYNDEPVDRAFSLSYVEDYLEWARRNGSAAAHWRDLAAGRPPALVFWYRTSPAPLVPKNPLSTTSQDDPSLTVAGMTALWTDTNGRLTAFTAVPPQVEKTSAPHAVTDWRPLFAAAGLEMATFTETTPERTPATYADERHSWQGTLPDAKTAVKIEAAGYRGRPISFEIVGPWTKAYREIDAQSGDGQRRTISTIIILLLVVAAVVLARRNIRSGRADRRGAFRLAVFLFFLIATTWVFLPHVSDLGEDTDRMFAWVGIGMFVGGVMYLVYLAVEPFVRKSWPTMLVGWSRALTARGRDAVIGRDIVIGVACGLALQVIDQTKMLLPRLLGWPEPIPQMPPLAVLEHTRYFIPTITSSMNNGLQNALISVMFFTIFREIVRRFTMPLNLKRVSPETVAAGLALLLTALIGMALSSNEHTPLWLRAVEQCVGAVVFLVVLLRYGLLATAVGFTINSLAGRMLLTLNPDALYSGSSLVALALIFAVALLGLWMARAGEPMFGKAG
jgi:predicted Ser/Thr protein kinase